MPIDGWQKRFLKKVKKTAYCWEWQAAKTTGRFGGYGCLNVRLTDGTKKTMLSHRLSWLLHKGEMPGNLCVLHKCDNPSCVNPDHLFLGTRQDNVADMVSKGRQVAGEKVKALWANDEYKEKTRLAMKKAKRPPFSRLHRLHLSEAFSGRIMSDDTRTKMSLSHFGKRHSEETRRKMSAAHRGFQHSEESRLKMRASWILRKQRKLLSNATGDLQ